MKGKKLCYGLLLASFIMVGLSLSVFSEDSSAIDDYTYTWDFTTHPELILCGSGSSFTCSDYSYIVFHPLSTCTGGGPAFYVSGLDSSNQNSLISVCHDIIVPVGSSSLIFLTGGVNLGSRYSGDVEITLTDSFGPSCPECQVCPVVPEYPYEDDLTNIKNAVLLVGAVPIVIYFFYAIYKMIIGGVK